MTLTVNGKNLSGSISAVASKSMAHRLLICAALSDGVSHIKCETLSDDIRATAACLSRVSANVEYKDSAYTVTPHSCEKSAEIDCGESGSTLRFLLPVICALGVEAGITMHGRLPMRPLSPLYEELVRHGALLSEQGQNPMITGGKLSFGEYKLDAGVSSQFISGLLFALPLLPGDSRIVLTGKRESASYVEMTISALALYGICIKSTENGYEIPGNQRYMTPGSVTVEGDWSNAAFWKCAAFLGAPVTVTGLSDASLQGDMAVEKILLDFAAEGEVRVDASNIPDLVPALSVAACGRKGKTVIYNAARLRIKESDRLKTVTHMLSALGADITETEDGLVIMPSVLHPGKVDAAGDHRIAMSAAAASVLAGDVTVIGAECAAKSYPAFYEDFASLGGKIEIN